MASSSSSGSASYIHSTPTSPADDGPRTRILNHMNADHKDSILLYLRHFSNIPPLSPGTPDPELIDISLAGITISHHLSPKATTPAITFIPFTPPIESLSQSRARLVAMTEESEQALGLTSNSEKAALTRVTAPGVVGFTISLLVLQTIVCFCPGIVDLYTLSHSDPHHSILGPNPNPAYPADLPDTLYTRYMMFNQPWLVRFISAWRREFWALVVGIHFAEAVYMDRRLTAEWGVKRLSGVWMGWVGWAFMEGFGSFQRASRVCKGEEEKGKKKH
ncbi:hypothetical protein BGX38DRAFT_1270848 [Terfezia claveryi]|nr:hypothetical protein BGX38DRAFT_1270848 [Terfezia claveryi]